MKPKMANIKLQKKGRATAEDVEKINDVVKKQLEVLLRLGNVGRFVALDIIEKITTMGSLLSSKGSNMTKNETERYRKFLKTELDRLSEKATKKKGKQIKIE